MNIRPDFSFFKKPNDEKQNLLLDELSWTEISQEEIGNDLGEECEFEQKKGFDIAMGTVAMLSPHNKLQVLNLINQNSLMVNSQYDLLCTTGVASCLALCSIGLNSNNDTFLFLSHTDELPFAAKSQIKKWMEGMGINRVFNLLIGGTSKSRIESEDFFYENPNLKSFGLNDSYEDETDNCSIFIGRDRLIVRQFHGETNEVKKELIKELSDLPYHPVERKRISETFHQSFNHENKTAFHGGNR